MAYDVPSWQAGLGPESNVGGLIAAVLDPLGGFGKFLLVLLALSVTSASSPTLYIICTSTMTVSESLAKLPRFVLAIVATAVYVVSQCFGVS